MVYLPSIFDLKGSLNLHHRRHRYMPSISSSSGGSHQFNLSSKILTRNVTVMAFYNQRRSLCAFTCMNKHVCLQCRWSSKTFTTSVTTVWFCSCMDNRMSLQCRWLSKTFTTNFTFMWPIP